MKELDRSWRWIVAMLKARGVWVVGREGEAKEFIWWRFLQKCTQNCFLLADALILVTSQTINDSIIFIMREAAKVCLL